MGNVLSTIKLDAKYDSFLRTLYVKFTIMVFRKLNIDALHRMISSNVVETIFSSRKNFPINGNKEFFRRWDNWILEKKMKTLFLSFIRKTSFEK